FQTLGQVIHHLQDMAQPQHVRNDPHLVLSSVQLVVACAASVLDPVLCGLILYNLNPSLYERYTERSKAYEFVNLAAYPSPYSASDTQTFLSPRQFWQNLGKGIAEYTNQGFVSDGTNFRGPPGTISTAPGFDNPAGATASINPVTGAQLRPVLGCPGDLSQTVKDDDQLWFIGTTVRDSYTGVSSANSFTSTYSIFDADLERRGKSKVFSLNRFNFCAAHSYLLPRAVGYS